MINRLAMYMPNLGDCSMGERELLQVAVARIEEQQKNLINKLDGLMDVLEKVDQRVIKVEEFKWKLVGIATAIGSVAALITKMVTFKL